MRWSESKSKTSKGKQTLGDSSDPTPATNMVAELRWAKDHVVGPNHPKINFVTQCPHKCFATANSTPFPGH